MDRLDLQLELRRLSPAQLRRSGDTPAVTSAELRVKVASARAAARQRFEGLTWCENGRIPSRWLTDGPGRLPRNVTAALERHYQRCGMSMRGYVRVLRVAWTLADLDGVASPNVEHVGEALALREGRAA
jgi:magnesium chelatase family protein